MTEGSKMNGAVKTVVKPNEAAAYIEQTAAALGDLAKRSGMDFLVYLLEMVRLEAASRVLSLPDAPGEPPTASR